MITNALDRYHAGVQAAGRVLAAERAASGVRDIVPLDLPEPSDALVRFTDVTDIAISEADTGLFLLDLTRNAGSRTAKTMASLVMVLRAVHHIRRTGERLLLVTPTSGNKGTALRDAIARAYATGLASPEELRIVIVVPEASRNKLRTCALSEDAALRGSNPVALAKVVRPADVKDMAAEVVTAQAARLAEETGFRIWYTLDLDNYRMADAVRAFAEAELLPITSGSPPRVHAHAVSSAYGLLGYNLGHRILTGQPGGSAPATRTGVALRAPFRHPGLLLVQQLATPDMVVSALGTETPRYVRDEDAAVWRQSDNPAFPPVADDPAEVIDPTFYTSAPATSTQVNGLIKQYGGGGVVVSKRECLSRFSQVRSLAEGAGISINADPAQIREWSLVKALTGVLEARERGLLDRDADVVVHASGNFTDALLPPMAERHIERMDGAEDLARLLFTAATAR